MVRRRGQYGKNLCFLLPADFTWENPIVGQIHLGLGLGLADLSMNSETKMNVSNGFVAHQYAKKGIDFPSPASHH